MLPILFCLLPFFLLSPRRSLVSLYFFLHVPYFLGTRCFCLYLDLVSYTVLLVLSSSIRIVRPIYFNFCLYILSKIGSTSNSTLISSFFILSFRMTPLTALRYFIFIVYIVFFTSLFRTQLSQPYMYVIID